MSAPPDLMTLAQQLVAQGKYRTVQEAAAAITSGRERVPGGYTQSVPSSGQRQPGPGAPRPQGVAPAQAPSAPQAPASSRPRRPGVYERPDSGESDRYGPSRIMNSNAPGVQSNGDDDPWSIGAFEGGTYDPQTMKVLFDRARQGDGEAAYILRQVGFFDESNKLLFNSQDGLEQWAKSRRLDRRAAAGDPSPWYHDPTNFGEQGFRNEQDARDAYDMAPWNQILGDDERASPWRRPQAVGPGPTVPPGYPGSDPAPYQKLPSESMPPVYPLGVNPDGSISHQPTPIDMRDPNRSSSAGARPAEEAIPQGMGMLGKLFPPEQQRQPQAAMRQRDFGGFTPQAPMPDSPLNPPQSPSYPLPGGGSLGVARQRDPEEEDPRLPWHGFRFR